MIGLMDQLDYFELWHEDIFKRRRAGLLSDTAFVHELEEWEAGLARVHGAIERYRDAVGANYCYNLVCQALAGEAVSDPAAVHEAVL